MLNIQPILIGIFVDYLTGSEDVSTTAAYVCAALMPTLTLAFTIVQNFASLIGRMSAAKMKSACCVLIYKKVLLMN